MSELWRTEPEGKLSAEINGRQLVVETAPGGVRFRVLLPAPLVGSILIASGILPDAMAAMAAAERIAWEQALEDAFPAAPTL